jgi:hypothetical protein
MLHTHTRVSDMVRSEACLTLSCIWGFRPTSVASWLIDTCLHVADMSPLLTFIHVCTKNKHYFLILIHKFFQNLPRPLPLSQQVRAHTHTHTHTNTHAWTHVSTTLFHYIFCRIFILKIL